MEDHLANIKKSITYLLSEIETMSYNEAESHLEKLLFSYELNSEKFDKIEAFQNAIYTPTSKKIEIKKITYEDQYLQKRKKSKKFSMFSNNIEEVKKMLFEEKSYLQIATFLNQRRANMSSDISFSKQNVYGYIKELKELKKW